MTANVGVGVSVSGGGGSVADAIWWSSFASTVNAAAVCTSLGGGTCSADGRLQAVKPKMIINTESDKRLLNIVLILVKRILSPVSSIINQKSLHTIEYAGFFYDYS